MGFIKWIKKELKSTSSHNRRESAPAYISNEFDPNLARDEAYLKALNTFNEWRTNQRLERLSREPQAKTPAKVLEEVTKTDKIVENFKNFEEFKINQTLYENTINLETKSPRKENRRMRRYSPPYQTVVNKHGDIVEYAMPYCEPDAPAPASSADTLNNDMSRNTSFSEMPNKLKDADVIVTDLDRSADSRVIVLSSPPASNDHNQLQQPIQWNSPWRNESSSQHLARTNGVLIAEPNENWFRTNIFHSPSLPLLEYSKGIFRNTDVGFRTNKIISRDSVFVSKYALQRDMDILNSIRQTNIVMLMAISYDDYDEFKRMSLILEPFDCTINHFLYEMNQQFSVLQIIKIMQQISGAVIYLHECGYVHSNISTNSILITKYQSIYIAKLANFELTTELNYHNIQNDIKTLYQTSASGDLTKNYYRQDWEQLEKISEYIILLKNVQRNLKEQYFELSRNKNLIAQSNQNAQLDNFSRFNGKIERKYYPYYVEYRKLFSLYYYESPELMDSSLAFVYPTKSTDIYQMTLLLWEMLNSCIPFVIFNELEMEKLYSSNLQCSILNNFSEHCKYFDKILKYGLQIPLRKRIMTVKHLKLLLDNVEIELIKEGVLEEEKMFVTPAKSELNLKSDNTTHFASFNQFLALKTPDTYERTSTLKKRIKMEEEPPKKAARELFNKLDDELDMIPDEIKFNKSDIMKEFDFTGHEKEDLVDIQENIVTDFSTAPPPKPTRHDASTSFNLIDLSIPDTPIARKNKLRKQAWLNGYRFGGKPTELSRGLLNQNISPPLASRKLDQNIIKPENQCEEETKNSEQLTNLADDISKCINDKFKDLLPDFTNKILNELKVAETDKYEKKSAIQMEEKPIHKYVEDRTFNITDIITEAMKRKERRALLNQPTLPASANPSDSESSDSESTPKRISVHEAVAKIEKRNQNSMLESSLNRKNSLKCSPKKPLIEFKPPSTPSIPIAPPAPVTPIMPIRTALCKKITTRVTLNFRKSSQIPSPRVSDVNLSNFQQPVTLQRHSISSREIMQLMDRQKINQNMKDLLFCNNCHSQIKHSNILGMFSSQNNNLPPTESYHRSSDASNMLRLDRKSTEDLYIDDDFCQGINLGANMELITIDTNEEDDFLNFDLFASNDKRLEEEEEEEDSGNVNDNQNETKP